MTICGKPHSKLLQVALAVHLGTDKSVSYTYHVEAVKWWCEEENSSELSLVSIENTVSTSRCMVHSAELSSILTQAFAASWATDLPPPAIIQPKQSLSQFSGKGPMDAILIYFVPDYTHFVDDPLCLWTFWPISSAGSDGSWYRSRRFSNASKGCKGHSMMIKEAAPP